MAAVTVTKRRESVIGSDRMVTATLTIADTNTWVTGLKLIKSLSVIGVDKNTIGATVSGGTVTFGCTGTETGALAQVVGL
jgi:hypothetical protein